MPESLLGGGAAPAVEDSLASAPPQPAVSSPEYDVVDVFYGTDRHLAAAIPGDLWHALARFVPTGCGILVTLALAMFAVSRRTLGPWLVTVGSLGVSLGLGYHAASTTLVAIRYAGREGPQYSSDRSPQGHIDRGICQVTIPKKHTVGEVESPSLTRLEIVEDASRHVVLQKTNRLADAAFYNLLRQRVEQSERRELFVFVHGFNVSFADAARRTAQIHHDLKFDGAPLFFSWPAHDKFIFTYPADETNVAWSVPHLKQFLLEIVKESQARSINLIAHSMGNRALAAALREIELEMRDSARLFNQVILAAPDIDADDFRNNIAPAMQRTAQRLTLYASSRDDALLASQLVHRGPRAGDAGEGLVVIPGIDTIDVTAIDSSPWGHSYYGSSDPVLHDLQTLLNRAVPPRDRSWLSPAQRDGLTYWIFQPARTASAADDSAR
jgi:esterase/lipase superfamily enzyme